MVYIARRRVGLIITHKIINEEDIKKSVEYYSPTTLRNIIRLCFYSSRRTLTCKILLYFHLRTTPTR